MAVDCPASTATNRCRGNVRVERGRLNLVKRSFSVTAEKFRNVTMRLSKSDYRALKRDRNGKRVRVTVITRDAAKTLRRATVKVTMRAKR